MSLTETEARNKWCPFVRIAAGTDTTGGTTINRRVSAAGIDDYCKCIASDCMAWQWVREPRNFGTEPDRGYCGLAGRPDQ